MLNRRGEETRQLIKKSSCALFAEKGFKQVTMKDICERTQLSRGGLYCHYSSTQEIFHDILDDFMNHQEDTISEKIAQNIPAVNILNDILETYRQEMMDSPSSLSLAILEYFSLQNLSDTENELFQQYQMSLKSWKNLIRYGIERGEFHHVDVEAVFHLIIFAYQGVRMYSKLMPIKEDIPTGVVEQIKKILIKKNQL